MPKLGASEMASSFKKFTDDAIPLLTDIVEASLDKIKTDAAAALSALEATQLGTDVADKPWHEDVAGEEFGALERCFNEGFKTFDVEALQQNLIAVKAAIKDWFT